LEPFDVVAGEFGEAVVALVAEDVTVAEELVPVGFDGWILDYIRGEWPGGGVNFARQFTKLSRRHGCSLLRGE
jgi:hypothetical protein